MILKKHPPVLRQRRLPDGTYAPILSNLFSDDPVPVRGLTDMSDENLHDWLKYWSVREVTVH